MSWQEKIEEARQWASEARAAEEREDWVDALACWEEAHDMSLGDDFRDECWREMQRVRKIAERPREVRYAEA